MSIIQRGSKAVDRRDANRRVKQRQRPDLVQTVTPCHDNIEAGAPFNS